MNLKAIEKNWAGLQAVADIGPITSDRHYARSVALADALVDSGKAGDGGALEGLFLILCDLIEAYDREHHRLPNTPPHELLRALMAEQGLTQGQLPEVGNQSVVSQVLAGKRAINARQARALAKRFKLPVSVFIGDDPLH